MSQNKDLKVTKVENLKTLIDSSKVLVLADYKGLKVSQINDLRGKIKKAGGNLAVAKNTLLKLALKSSRFSPLSPDLETHLAGPTAILFAIDDEVSPLKALSEFAKVSGLPLVKTGASLDKILSSGEVARLASLPSREVLISMLLRNLKSPITSFVYVASANHRKLLYVLAQIQKEKPSN